MKVTDDGVRVDTLISVVKDSIKRATCPGPRRPET